MRLLVDTHAWLWMLASPDRIPARTREQLADPAVDVLVSAATAWEIAIKYELGKLPLPEHPTTWVPDRIERTGSTPLAVEHEHALRAGALPRHHRDPFDRMLVAQSQALDMPLVSADTALAAYDVVLAWE